jgi:hypothetical protein
MSFRAAVIVIKPASVGTGIKATLRKQKAEAKLTLSISDAVAMKELNWSAGDKVEVLIGEGEHHGLLRLRKNNSVGVAVVEKRNALKGGYFAVALGCQPAFVDRKEVGRWCQWEKVEEGWVEIVLPNWADETAPRKAAQLAAPRPNGVAPQQRRGTDVTSHLMGDPAPGRREAMEKVGR